MEVQLYSRYETRTESPRVAREDLRYWYDGCHTLSSKRIYNPRSVVEALDRNSIQSYWTRTGPYSEISTYIVNDIDDVKKDVALMVAGEAVKASVEEFCGLCASVYASTLRFAPCSTDAYWTSSAASVVVKNLCRKAKLHLWTPRTYG